MNDQNHWEKQLQSWTPRRPSADVATKLFGTAPERARTYRRRAEFLSWLTPVAACVLTVMVAWGGGSRHPVQDNPAFFAMAMSNSAAESSISQTLALTKTDVNLQWNYCIWPRNNSDKVTNYSAPASNLESWNAAATNR